MFVAVLLAALRRRPVGLTGIRALRAIRRRALVPVRAVRRREDRR